MTFYEWWDTTKAAATPDTSAGLEQFCRQAWDAAHQDVERIRVAFDRECARTDSLLTILGVPAWCCRSEGGSLMPHKVLTLMGEERADQVADALRFRWLCENPDWHFIERLCREFVADSNIEFLVALRRVIDARRAVELGPFEEHIPPGIPAK